MHFKRRSFGTFVEEEGNEALSNPSRHHGDPEGPASRVEGSHEREEAYYSEE